MQVFWHSQKYACSMQRSNSNKINMIADFMHLQESCDANFTIFVSHIFTSSTIRSWIDNDESAIDCTSCSISARLSRWNALQHVVQGKIIWLPLLLPRIISTENIRSYIDADIQILISSGHHGKSPSQDARFRRWIMRRCTKMHKSVDKINNTNFKNVYKICEIETYSYDSSCWIGT